MLGYLTNNNRSMADQHKTIGQRLRQIRLNRGLTQSAFAQRYGYVKATQIKYEKDEAKPKTAYWEAMRADGIDISFLLGEELDGEPLRTETPNLKTLCFQLETFVSNNLASGASKENILEALLQTGVTLLGKCNRSARES